MNLRYLTKSAGYLVIGLPFHYSSARNRPVTRMELVPGVSAATPCKAGAAATLCISSCRVGTVL